MKVKQLFNEESNELKTLYKKEFDLENIIKSGKMYDASKIRKELTNIKNKIKELEENEE